MVPLKHRFKVPPAALLVLGSTTLAASQDSATGCLSECSFLSENRLAMERMMTGMAVPPTGSIDRDFVTMMIAHHQGAIEMAKLQLRFGHNEQLRRITQEIIVEQQQEISAMYLALGEPVPSAKTGPAQPEGARSAVDPLPPVDSTCRRTANERP